MPPQKRRGRTGQGARWAAPWRGPGRPAFDDQTGRFSSLVIVPDGYSALLYGPEQFTGANGGAPAASWTTGTTPTGGSALIQGNALRFTTGTTGGYAGASRVSRRVNITDPVNAVILSKFRIPAGQETFPRFYVRSTNTTLDTQGGYFFEAAGTAGYWTVGKGTAYSDTDLVTGSITWTTDVWYWVRFGAVDNRIKMRFWLDGSAEPTEWTADTTDTDLTAAGPVGVSVGQGNLGNATFEIDDFAIYDSFGPEAAVPTYEGWGMPVA